MSARAAKPGGALRAPHAPVCPCDGCWGSPLVKPASAPSETGAWLQRLRGAR